MVDFVYFCAFTSILNKVTSIFNKITIILGKVTSVGNSREYADNVVQNTTQKSTKSTIGHVHYSSHLSFLFPLNMAGYINQMAPQYL